jgi:hypothetical protein
VLVDEWRPQSAVIDMDISGDRLVERLGWSGADGVTRVPTNDEPGDGRMCAVERLTATSCGVAR